MNIALIVSETARVAMGLTCEDMTILGYRRDAEHDFWRYNG